MSGVERTSARLDKWLWAARFYKSRGLAKTAIEGGKVHLNGARAKASKTIAVGDELAVTRGETVQTVIVAEIAERRGSATAAATLYSETTESIARRERIRAERRMLHSGLKVPKRRPNKHQRRALLALKAAEPVEGEA